MLDLSYVLHCFEEDTNSRSYGRDAVEGSTRCDQREKDIETGV
jgi:hypothetical protein